MFREAKNAVYQNGKVRFYWLTFVICIYSNIGVTYHTLGNFGGSITNGEEIIEMCVGGNGHDN